jgi:hypothetical protein
MQIKLSSYVIWDGALLPWIVIKPTMPTCLRARVRMCTCMVYVNIFEHTIIIWSRFQVYFVQSFSGLFRIFGCSCMSTGVFHMFMPMYVCMYVCMYVRTCVFKYIPDLTLSDPPFTRTPIECKHFKDTRVQKECCTLNTYTATFKINHSLMDTLQ